MGVPVFHTKQTDVGVLPLDVSSCEEILLPVRLATRASRCISSLQGSLCKQCQLPSVNPELSPHAACLPLAVFAHVTVKSPSALLTKCREWGFLRAVPPVALLARRMGIASSSSHRVLCIVIG